jgi:hypothetical protein
MEAQSLIAERVTRAGATDAQVDNAIAVSEPAHPELLAPEELYLGSLARFVNALGGDLRLAAVFGDEGGDEPPRQ